MALKNFLHKLASTDADADADARPAGTPSQEGTAPRAGVVAIRDVVARQPSTIVGEIASVHVVAKAGAPWLEVTVSDGTGKLVAMWTGRREIDGITECQRLLLSGRAAPSGPGGRLLLYNPRYELL